MGAEIASFALMLALSLSLFQGSALLLRAPRPYVPAAASASALLVFLSFILLIVLRIDSDFTVANVAQHSNRALDLLYKITGTWGNHEGSMLLWALVVTLFGALLARHEHILNQQAASVQAWLTAGVLGFILFASNPFARIFPPPTDGSMLNPLLQDVALAMHPPMLYLGYVGFSAVFSLAVAGLLIRKIDSDWGYSAHPWIMAAWSALTLGIALGSWWAYRELGWGGFWFWDPVENASLLPWLAGTALLHSNIVLKKRAHLAGWVSLLAILTFGLSLIGTFLVRSGVITSVHSFASDPARGTYILVYIIISIGAALALYGARIGSISTPSPIRPASREGVIVINNLFLITACATVLLGTFYPIIAEAISGEKVSVGAPYFNATFLPLMAIPLFFAALAPFIPWKKAALGQALLKAWPAWAVAAVTAILFSMTVTRHMLLAVGGLTLAAFLMCASAQWMAAKHFRNLTHWSVFLGHVGAALMVIGITGVSLWSSQTEKLVGKGDAVMLAGYQLEVTAKDTIEEANYTADRLTLSVEKGELAITTLAPEFRRYKNGATTSEASIHSTPAYDLYTVAGETQNGKTALRVYFRPSISFIWMGALIITLGGLFAAFTAITIKARES